LPQKAGRIDESGRGLDRIELVAPDAAANTSMRPSSVSN
jgi:hypothetical protein